MNEKVCNICGDFIAVSAGLDPTDYCNLCAQEEVVRMSAEIERLKETLRDAKECIRIWHNMDAHGMDQAQIESLWRSYDQNSPEENKHKP
jgi:hypothetical protein